MAVMATDGPSPHSPSLHLSLTAPQPSRRHHAQSLLGPSLQDPRTHHVHKSHPKWAAPLSCRDDERRHAVDSHFAPALRLYLAACNPSFESSPSLLQFVSIVSHLMIHGNLISVPVSVFTFSSSASAFLRDLNKMNFSLKPLFAIWSLSPQRFLGHYYFYLSIVS